jgi:hypothetical protein
MLGWELAAVVFFPEPSARAFLLPIDLYRFSSKHQRASRATFINAALDWFGAISCAFYTGQTRSGVPSMQPSACPSLQAPGPLQSRLVYLQRRPVWCHRDAFRAQYSSVQWNHPVARYLVPSIEPSARPSDIPSTGTLNGAIQRPPVR